MRFLLLAATLLWSQLSERADASRQTGASPRTHSALADTSLHTNDGYPSTQVVVDQMGAAASGGSYGADRGIFKEENILNGNIRQTDLTLGFDILLSRS